MYLGGPESNVPGCMHVHLPAEKEHSDHFAKLLSEVRERRKKSSGQELTREGGEEQMMNEGGSKKDCGSTRYVYLWFGPWVHLSFMLVSRVCCLSAQ